jgi:hypothetical protein
MNITSAKYWRPFAGSGENTCINVVADGQSMSVPLDNANTDYQAVMAWKDEGNTIEEAD